MKKIIFLLLLHVSVLMAFSFPLLPNSEPRVIVVGHTSGSHNPQLANTEPSLLYYENSRQLAIEFPVVGFEPYVLSVTSGYATLDYYVTTPQMCVLISPDAVEVNLLLETDGGDLYWGSFDTTSGTLTE